VKTTELQCHAAVEHGYQLEERSIMPSRIV